MNSDTLAGDGRDLGGKIKETVGNVIGDSSIQGEGIADQISGKVQKTYGVAKDAITDNVGPLSDQVKKFAKERPFATAALAGVVGLALINTLRGK